MFSREYSVAGVVYLFVERQFSKELSPSFEIVVSMNVLSVTSS